MKFNMKSYLIEDNEKEDELEEYQDNIEVLKKAGMDTLVEKITSVEEENSTPFPKLGKEEIRIYDLSYQHRTSVAAFNQIVPLKVASVLALCKEKDYFKNVYICCDVEVHNVLMSSYIAIGEESSGDKYIIAQWSISPLKKYEEIKEAAIPLVRKRLTDRIAGEIKEKEKDLAIIEELTEKYINGEYISYYLI